MKSLVITAALFTPVLTGCLSPNLLIDKPKDDFQTCMEQAKDKAGDSFYENFYSSLHGLDPEKVKKQKLENAILAQKLKILCEQQRQKQKQLKGKSKK
ncbi:hypothetical protein D5018_19985 [Parashewanella curva]|uniref:Lipoprotein n=1 Tax=Parashewanella curva TaxID=2338552 RepID=A0A3L8PRD5_9GAMM|nr:hypothetical protein [Parashewanella curva]RLV57936.1 hypothetical protein D5018_19985 [Parashewanella curva]